MANTDFRFDPFRQVFRPVFQSNEVHVAQYFDALGRVGFFTKEAVQRRSPSSVVLKDAGNVTLSEVSRTTVPTYSTYRVDYSALTFWSHCFVEVHETRIGGVFTISYHGLGTGLNSSNRSDDRFNIERSVTVAGGLTAESLSVLGASMLRGNVSLATGTGSTISASGNRIQNVGDAVLPTDLISLMEFTSLVALNSNRIEILSGSGNWIRNPNTRYVFFTAIGGGGSGSNGGNTSGSSQGGGGGAGSTAIYGIADLDALGGTSFAYNVGGGGGTNGTTSALNGTASTIFGCSSGRGLGGTRNTVSGTTAGGLTTGGSIGSNVIGKVVSGSNGSAGSGANSGAGGDGAPMFGPGSPFLAGTGGATVSGAVVGNVGTVYGAGGSGGGGHPFLDSNGATGSAGFILLIY